MLTLPGERGGHYCKCTMDGLKLDNMERIWKSLSEVPLLPGMREKPLLGGLLSKNVWITTNNTIFKSHLKALAFNMSSMWECRVYEDGQLLDSWFGTAKAQGVKIFDLEVDKSTLEAIDIRDLVVPPELLILMLGVKHLPNKESPNALLEAIATRRHVGKPTWLIDQPDQPIDQPYHKFYSETLESWISYWPHLQLGKQNLRVVSAGHVKTVSETTSDLDDYMKTEGSEEVDEVLDDLDSSEEKEVQEDEEDEEEAPDWMETVNTAEASKKKPYGKKKPWGKNR